MPLLGKRMSSLGRRESTSMGGFPSPIVQGVARILFLARWDCIVADPAFNADYRSTPNFQK
jgi:hypothetical protein